ncbi:hypothetical protein LIER_17459 [Lithospermum erythrorhizon]|uniref:SBP-type domain-containing protein n=1 Tax=Lithospermum erythrorhizon TaxID=34254 RepID=A0AAV3QFT9_LITER
MSSFMETELSARWGFENLVMFGSKVSGDPKKPQLEDWVFGENDEMNAGSFNLSGVGCGSGGSGSEFGNGSSGKSSISASANSSPKIGLKSSGFAFEDLRGSFGDFTDQVGAEMSGASPLLEPSIGSIELTTDLKLGKRACLESSWSAGSEKSPSSVISTPSTTASKKMKPPSLGGSPIPRCQVEGCNLDLSSAKDYHRKHRVCDDHSKSSKVIVKGVERRFCQQCSRFHGLSEFDQKKRSCRRRLCDHNARRRKPQQETIAFNSSRPSSSFYDGRKQMTFLLNTRGQTRNAASSDWESTYESKFTITKGYTPKYDNPGLVPGQPLLTGNQASDAIRMHGNPSNGLLAPTGIASSRVLSPQGFKDVTSATVGAAPDFHRALSLLSTNPWGSCEPVSIPFDNTIHATRVNMPQTLLHAIPQSSLPSSEYWLDGQQPSTYPRVHSLTSGSSGIGHNEGFQLAKTSYGRDFYVSPLQD